MTAFFPTIVAVLLGLSFEEFYAESAMPEEHLGLLLLALPLSVLPALAGHLLLRLCAGRLRRARPLDAQRLAGWLRHTPLPLYILVLFGLGWPKIVVPLGIEGTVLLDHVVVLLPYFVALAGAEFQAQRLRRPFRMGPDGPVPAGWREVSGSVAELGRHLGLLLVPLVVLVFFLDVAMDTPLRLYFDRLPLLSAVALLLLLLALSAVYPLLFRLGMGLRPLLSGAPLRRRLEELAAHLGFGCRDILYWPTRRRTLNAAVVGLLPRWRYVILTEELCRRLTLEELCAVFAHEVGHGKRHHALTYLLFSVAYLTALVPVGDGVGTLVARALGWRLDPSLAAAVLVYLPAFAGYWFLFFSALSRRFELEADVFAVEATGDAAKFIITLEKVARIGRIDRFRKAPRHFSIEGRADFLRQAFLEGRRDLLDAFRRRIKTLRRVVHGAAALVLVAAAALLFVDSLKGAGSILLERGFDLRARELLQSYVRLVPDDPYGRALLAEIDLYFDTPPPPDGGPHWRRVLSLLDDLDPPDRARLLDALRGGWARALARDRTAEALALVERARRVNRVTLESEDETAAIFDAGFELALQGMERATRALAGRDREALRRLLRKPPRWLRRADAAAALRRLKDAAFPAGSPGA